MPLTNPIHIFLRCKRPRNRRRRSIPGPHPKHQPHQQKPTQQQQQLQVIEPQRLWRGGPPRHRQRTLDGQNRHLPPFHQHQGLQGQMQDVPVQIQCVLRQCNVQHG